MNSPLEERLRTLRREFVEGLPARADEVERWRTDTSLGPEVLARICHRLRGLAPTHGLSELGAHAASIEDRARRGSSRAELDAAASGLVILLRQPAEEASSPEIAPLQPLHGYRVIAIDDDPAMRRLLQLTLVELGGADATVVETEEAFVAALERGPVDLIIADVMMPGTTGPELLARAERRGLIGPARVALLSASGSNEHESDLRWPRLAKPFRPPELVGALLGIVRGPA